jgi:hypothetical protein
MEEALRILLERFPFLRVYPALSEQTVHLAGVHPTGLSCQIDVTEPDGGWVLHVPSTLNAQRIVASLKNEAAPCNVLENARHMSDMIAALLPSGRAEAVMVRVTQFLASEDVIFTVNTHDVATASTVRAIDRTWSICFLHANVNFLVVVSAASDETYEPRMSFYLDKIELIPTTREEAVLMQRLREIVVHTFVSHDNVSDDEDNDADDMQVS